MKSGIAVLLSFILLATSRVDARNPYLNPIKIFQTQIEALGAAVVLIGVQVAHEQARLSKLQQNKLSWEQIVALSGKAAIALADNPRFWFGVTGAAIAGITAFYPSLSTDKLLMRLRANLYTRRLLQISIGSAMTFVGWELASKLWDQARLQLTQSEFEESEQIHLVLQNSSVIRKIVGNLKDILLQSPDQRRLWIYNTWRLSLGTGDFIGFSAAMILASSLVHFFPITNQLAQMTLASAVGGALFTMIPISAKDGISESIGRARLATLRLRIRKKFESLQSTLASAPTLVETDLTSLSRLRESAINIYLENLHRDLRRINFLKGQRAIARQNLNRSAERDLNQQIQKPSQEFHRTLDEMLRFYQDQVNEIKHFSELADQEDGIAIRLERELAKLGLVGLGLTAYAAELSETFHGYPLEGGAIAALRGWVQTGFHEADLTRAIFDQVAPD